MKILIIRLSSIGDILLTTPVARCIKRQLPDVQVHFLTKSANRELLAYNPNVDRVFTLRDSIKETLAPLKNEHYDCIVDLHNNRRTRWIRHLLKISSSFKTRVLVYRKENISKFVTVLTKIKAMSGNHVVDRYLRAVAPLGVIPDDGGLDFFLSPEMQGDALLSQTVGKKTVGQLTAERYVVVACGAQHETKRIPLDKLRLLCSMIKAPVLLLGDKADRTRISNWDISFKSNVTNLCGKTSIELSAALVRNAAAVITPDTAMMHIAAAFHRPVIAVWGATIPSFGFSAYSTEHADCEVPGLWCRPCSRMGSRRCPLRHFKCMHNQNWQAIANAADHLADSQPAS